MHLVALFLISLCFLSSFRAEGAESGAKTNYLLVIDAVEENGVLTCTVKVPKLPPKVSELPDVHFEHLKNAWIEGGGFSLPLSCPSPSQGGKITFSLPTDSLEGLTLNLDINVDGFDYINRIHLFGYTKRLAAALREFEDHMRKLEQERDRQSVDRPEPK